MTEWIRLASGVHPTVMDRMQRNLHGVRPKTDEDTIWVPDTQEHRRVFGLMDTLLDCHHRILRYAPPAKARPYKPLERDVLFLAVRGVLQRHPDGKGEAFLADLLHSLVWAQPLPNTNHRSALALVNQLAFSAGHRVPEPHEQRPAADAFIAESKPIIREKEFTPRPEAIKEAHHEAARRYINRVL